MEARLASLAANTQGGRLSGSRCLALRGVRGTLAAASVIVDVLMQAVSQLVFAIIGLILLVVGGCYLWWRLQRKRFQD